MYTVKRIDNTFETLVNGLPYHVGADDLLYADLAERYASLPAGMADVDGVVTEDNRGTPGWLNGEMFTMEDFGPLPQGFSETPPDAYLREEETRQAKVTATRILTAYMQRQAVQTAEFTPAEFGVFAKAGLFDEWLPNTLYEAGKRIAYEGTVYAVQQAHTSQAHQPPGSNGMLAVYRPISVDPGTGVEPDGSLANPYAYTHGMDVRNGKYYTFNGRTYLAKADMIPCIWDPGTPGVWQWELV